MIRLRAVAAVGVTCAALAACGGKSRTLMRGASNTEDSGGTGGFGGAGVGGASGVGGTIADGGTLGGGGSTGGTGGDGGSIADGGTAGGDPCAAPVPATSQVPRMRDSAYDNVMRDLLGVTTLPSANAPPSSLLAPDSDGSLTELAWSGYLAAAEQIAGAVMSGPSRAQFIDCDPADTECLTHTVSAFGRKAFRRPLTDEEVASFLRLADVTPPGTPDEIAEAILYAFLASPSFITLPELGTAKAGDAFALTSYEIATRLSFLLWNSLPDEALNAAADADQLTTREQVLAQAERMLEDDRARPALVAFNRYYLGMSPSSHWTVGGEHDPSVYPLFSSASLPSMLAEIDALFADVAFGGGSFEDLFLTDVAFVNRDTAPLYGLDAKRYGSDLTRVELDPERRPGLLTRAGFLATFSHYTSTAPMLRGELVTKLLGIEVPPPPPSPLQQPLPAANYATERELTDALTSAATCASCHQTYLNPPGYVLEHYDAVGSWQDVDPLGGAIDGTADVAFSETDIRTIASPFELMSAIGSAPGARRYFSQQLVAYASGRQPSPADDCIVNELTQRISEGGYPLLELFARYTQADSFRLRTKGD